ncbi:MAG: ribosome silencing factor [Dehalococcoidia bacterium]
MRDETGVEAPPGVSGGTAGDIDYAQMLLDVLVDRQASDVVLLDLTQLTVFSDYFLIATVDNIRQARAIVDALSEAASKAGEDLRAEGTAEEGWILVDAGRGVFAHLFSLESRIYYDLEGLWHRAQEIVRVQ